MNLHTSPSSLGSGRASFTLIELLIVIAVVAILSVVVILSLNPAELLRQAWDSNRIADMNTLNRILTYTRGNVGTTSTVYFSIVDPAATSTSGTDCAGVGGLVPPSGWSYHCAASSTLRAVDGTGWLPLDLSSPGFGGSLSGLPVDPTNTSSSGLYYMFVRGASGYAVAAGLQSQKFLGPRGSGDDGYDPGRIEMGSNLSLIAQSQGLVGWWPMEEGSGTDTADSSGSGNTGTLNNSPTWTTGKVGQTLQFDGSNDYVNASDSTSLSVAGSFTVTAWVKTSDNEGMIAGKRQTDVDATISYSLTIVGGTPYVYVSNGSANMNATGAAVNDDQWHHLAMVFTANSALRLYVDGALAASDTTSPVATVNDNTDPFTIGARSGSSNQLAAIIDEVRIYNRALTAAEVAAIYNAQK